MPLAHSQLGHYQLLHQIGSAEAGTIYLAQDLQLPRRVAVKVMRVGAELQADNNEVVKRLEKLFTREMQALVQLAHPHILPVSDLGTEEIGQVSYAYLAMHYCPAGSLADWLSQARNDQRLSLSTISSLLSQTAEALHHAHERGIVHQDLKPSNLLLRADSTQPATQPDLLLADFGMARLLAATSSQGLSQSPYLRSTYLSMAPEQWDGKAVPASDQYALAVLAFRLLTGQFPFQGSLSQVIHQHYRTLPPAPSSLNPQLDPSIDKIMQRALAKEPDRRFPSALDFAQAFAPFQQLADEQPGDQIYSVSSTLPTQILSESVNMPLDEPPQAALPMPTENLMLAEANAEIPASETSIILPYAILPTALAVAATVYPGARIPVPAKPAPPLPILRFNLARLPRGLPPMQIKSYSTVQKSLLSGLIALVILAGSGMFLFNGIAARANSPAPGIHSNVFQANATAQPGQTPASSGSTITITVTATATGSPTPTTQSTQPTSVLGPTSTPPPGTTPTPGLTPATGTAPQPTATATPRPQPTAKPTPKPTPTPTPHPCLIHYWTLTLTTYSKGGNALYVSSYCHGNVYLTLTQAPASGGHQIYFQICYAVNSTNCSGWVAYTAPNSWRTMASGLKTNQVFYINARCSSCTSKFTIYGAAEY